MEHPSNSHQSRAGAPLVRAMEHVDCSVQMTQKEYDEFMEAYSVALSEWCFDQWMLGIRGY